MEQFIIIAIFVGIGALFRRLPVFPEQTSQVLNMFALYVALPAVILLKIPQIQLSYEMIIPAIVPWAMLLLSVVLVCWAGHVFRWPRDVVAVLLLVVPLGNTSFMGVPMVLSFFGEKGIAHLIIYDQVGTMLIFAIYGSIVLALYAGNSNVRVTQVVLRTLFFPPTLALIAGLVVNPDVYPKAMIDCLHTLSGMLTPLVMTAIGFQLKLRLSPVILRPLGVAVSIKLLIAPLVAFLGCRALGLDGMAANVSIFEAGMPSMVTSGALAMAVGLLPELAAATVSLGMILSFLTLPFWYWVLVNFH